MKARDLGAVFASLPAAWADALPGWTSQRLEAVRRCIEKVSGDKPIAPDDPFRALRMLAPDTVKVVLIGQDPYPTAGHADGLAFSAGKGRPRSLARVFEVLAASRPEAFQTPETWALDDWARRGVLLLNPVLTVEVGRSGSHMDCGWQALTREIVEAQLRRQDPPAFLLWGRKAQAFFAEAERGNEARVFRTRHPSYDFDRGFMAEGSHFDATSDLVDWWRIGS